MRKSTIFFVMKVSTILILSILFVTACSTTYYYVTTSDLSGRYVGQYYYPENDRDPVDFTALLTIEDGIIIGKITELNTFGDKNVLYLYADVEGTISPDGTVMFIKTYDGTGDISHSVTYEGTMDFESMTITGTWTVDSSGTFEMHKE